MPNVDELLDGVSQVVTAKTVGTLYTVLDLKYAYNQLRLTADTAKQCNFSIVGGQATGTYRFLTGFYGLADMPAEFQKAMDRTLNHAKNAFCFLDDILRSRTHNASAKPSDGSPIVTNASEKAQ